MANIKTIGVYEETMASFQNKTGMASRNRKKTFVHAILAGFYFGLIMMLMTIMFTTVDHGSVLAALIHTFGLALVLIAGAELFTSHCMMETEALMAKTATKKAVAINLINIWLGNLVGAGLVSGLFYYTLPQVQTTQIITTLATLKLTLPLSMLIANGVFGGMFICLAVWMATRCKDNISKIFSIFLCSLAFVVCGAEHVVLNMPLFASAYIFDPTISLTNI